MTTALFTHPVCLKHDPGYSHPESIRRLKALLDHLSAPQYAALERREAPTAQWSQLTRVHHGKYVSKFFAAVPREGEVEFAADTVISPHTGDAARHGAGAICAAVDAVMDGSVDNAFCATRPPGHHAEPDRAMGFCFFNNVAIGAAHARDAHGLGRVAIFDFDVHHGNGTQEIFKDEPNVFFVSTHQWLIFPKTGARTEKGCGNILNIPLARGTRSDTFRRAVTDEVIPALVEFRPDFLMLSAGFDAHVADPIGGLRLTNDDFSWVTGEMVDFARRNCRGRIVSVLEGGYNPEGVAFAATAHIEALMAAKPVPRAVNSLVGNKDASVGSVPLLKPIADR